MDIRLWIWPKKKTVEHAIDALREASIAEHHAGAVSGDDKRIKAQEYEAAQKDMAHELEFRQRPNMRDVSDKSVHSNAAPVSQANNTFHEHSKLLPWIMLCCIISSFGMAMSVFSVGAVWVLYTKFHVLTVTVDNHDALMLREGIKQPGDVAKGPNGNLEFRHKE